MDLEVEPMQRLQGRSDVFMTFGVLGLLPHASKSILDELETTEFGIGQTKIETE